ncbi:MAG: hypothetical protein J4G05_07495 [Chlorobi bacterium]|nr:hypothetical protein [Chlorobiota bacterium]
MKRRLLTKHRLQTVVTGTILLLTGLFLPACEDDPILEPNQGSSGSGGSYDRIDLTPRDSNRVDKPVAHPLMSDPKTNPELF